MAAIGNIQQSYGKEIIIAVANTNGNKIMSSAALPKNSLIISAPMNDGLDIGTYALFMTDNNGVAARLTYSLQLGNGFVNNGDEISLKLDNRTIKANENNTLYVDLENIIDVQNLTEDGKISINNSSIDIATNTNLGILSIDDNTVKIIDGQIYIETVNLGFANNEEYGIVKSDNNTIHISDDGKLSVNTQNLNIADETTTGVVMVDNLTVKSNDGLISVDTENLQKASNTNYGVVKSDNASVNIDNSIMSVNTNKLNKATNTTKGIVKVDDTFEINNGVVSVKEYDDLIDRLNTMVKQMDTIETLIDEMNKKLSSL